MWQINAKPAAFHCDSVIVNKGRDFIHDDLHSVHKAVRSTLDDDMTVHSSMSEACECYRTCGLQMKCCFVEGIKDAAAIRLTHIWKKETKINKTKVDITAHYWNVFIYLLWQIVCLITKQIKSIFFSQYNINKFNQTCYRLCIKVDKMQYLLWAANTE